MRCGHCSPPWPTAVYIGQPLIPYLQIPSLQRRSWLGTTRPCHLLPCVLYSRLLREMQQTPLDPREGVRSKPGIETGGSGRMKQNCRRAVTSRARLAHVLLVVTLLAFTAVGCKKGSPTPAPTRTPGIVMVTPSVEVATSGPQPSPTPTNTAKATVAPTTQATVAPPTPAPQQTKPAYPGPMPEASLTPGAYPKP